MGRLSGQKALGRRVVFRILRWEDYSGMSAWTQWNQRVFRRGRQQGQVRECHVETEAGLRVEECKWPPEAGKGKNELSFSPPEPTACPRTFI